MAGLPKLPGLSFSDPTRTKFHISQTFEVINGYNIPKLNYSGSGGRQLDSQSVAFLKNQEPIQFDPSLVYGRTRGPVLPEFKPHFAHYDKKCLTFQAFFKQAVYDSPDENYRVRQVKIVYFLEDDTITVIEPFVRNCGFQQGRLIRRSKISKSKDGTHWHWKDLNVGQDYCFNGIVFHTVDCDGFTKEFMASQGIVINPAENMPPDPYIQLRELKVKPPYRITPQNDDKLRRHLEYEGKILTFNAAWDNRDREYGELREYTILYFLADDTVSVKEVHTPNDGCDPCPLLLRKIKLPKIWYDHPIDYPAIYLELSDNDVPEYYQPKDFIVGETVFVMGRRFLLFDCDEFTRNYYKKMLNIVQGPRINVFEKEKQNIEKCMPPHGELALGTLEDSLQNCFQTIPTRPRRNEICIITNANKYLRYAMKMDWVHPEDSTRKFLLLYSLAYGTCQIYEPPVPNSGHIGGKFLRDTLLIKPDSHPYNPDYYTPADFYIGAIIFVNSHRFRITGADLSVYRYMQINPEKFPTAVVDSVRNYMLNEGLINDDLQEKVKENETTERQNTVDTIGKHLEEIKTERDKCLKSIEENLAASTANIAGNVPENKEVKSITKMEPVKTHVDREVCKYGIKSLDSECPYSVLIGENYVDPDKLPCPESDETYTVKYPETKEQKLQKYYNNVLRQHEEACLRSAKYKRTHECLPGTTYTSYDNPELSCKILVTKMERPQPSKDSPCIKKIVDRVQPLEKCEVYKDDIYCAKQPKTTCDCTEYHKFV